MSKYTIIIFFFLLSHSGISQNYLGILFNNTHIGNNMGAYFEKDFKKMKIGLGLTYLFNNIPDYDQSIVFANQGYARNFGEGLGLNLGFLYNVFSYKENFKLYAGYRFFYSHSSIRSLALIPEVGISSQVGIKLYSLENVDFDAYHSLEHNLAMGLELNLTGRIILSQLFGAGFAFKYDLDDRLFGSLTPTRFFTGQGWETCYFFTIGVKYIIGGNSPIEKTKL